MRPHTHFFRWILGFLLLLPAGLGALAGGHHLSARAAPAQEGTMLVVINEIAWAGTQASQNDQWIELYNPGATEVVLTDWTLNAVDDSPAITLSGTIPANGYFLLEREDDDTVLDITADLIFTGDLNYDEIALELRDTNSNLIDTANLSGTTWYAGTGAPNYYSMERTDLLEDGPAAWHRNDGATTNGLAADGVTPLNGTPGQPNSPLEYDIFISEVAWAGTRASAYDEWIELYNPLGAALINLTGWKIEAADGNPSIPLTGSISENGYYILERGDDNVISDIDGSPPTYVYNGDLLSDSGETLYLLAPNRAVIDSANASGGAWPAGGGSNFASMERIYTAGQKAPDGRFAWITNDGTLRNGLDADNNNVFGTPLNPNWAFSVTPTASPTVSPTSTPTFTPTSTGARAVVINEVAWAGTKASSDDEWIELYNPSAISINLAGWVLKAADGSPTITLSGVLPSKDFLLLERTDDDTVADVTADILYSGSLSNYGEILRLYDPTNSLVDTANSNGSYWPAGNSSTYSSMQRSVFSADSDFVWVTYDASKDDPDDYAHDSAGNEIKGTPGRGNLPINVTPTVTPRSGASGSSSSSTGLEVEPILGISEFLPRPGHDWNNDGKVDVYDEFIEIINAGTVDVDLSAYELDDEQDQGSDPYSLPEVTLKPGERVVFYAEETGILLSDAGETVRLLDVYGNVIDARTYSVVRYPDQSTCRLPDRMGYWNFPCFPTPGNPNALTGTFPSLPQTRDGSALPVCLLADTIPQEFVQAECFANGGDIWNRQFWDGYGVFEFPLLDD